MSDQKYTVELLFIDNDPEFLESMEFAFGQFFSGIDTVSDFNSGLTKMENKNYNALLLDLALDRADEDFESGLNRIGIVKKAFPKLPVIIVTNDKKRETIIEALKKGATDFLYKGEYNITNWRDKVLSAIKEGRKIQLAGEEKDNYKITTNESPSAPKVRKAIFEEVSFIGKTNETNQIRKRIDFLSKEEENVTLLITGETGTGKEVAAKYFYQNGIRQNGPFQAVNLSAIPKELLESELFGHEKGAFTGAVRDKIGYFQQAHNGILFLDEIGEISEKIQIKLLRFLQDKVIRKVGSEKDIQLDVQIVAATNKDLKKEMKIGHFRPDFYERLSAESIHLPPLRDRKDDIALLIAHFMRITPTEVQEAFTPGAMHNILMYNWPRNIRELEQKVKAMIRNRKYLEKTTIDKACLPAEVTENESMVTFEAIKNQNAHLPHDELITLLDLKRIEEALISSSGKKGIVADRLGTDTDGLRYKVRTAYEKYKHLFDELPHIRKVYSKTLKKIDPAFSK